MVLLPNGPALTRWCEATFRKIINVRACEIPDSLRYQGSFRRSHASRTQTEYLTSSYSFAVAIAILGGYVVLATFGKLMSGGKKKEEAAPVAAAPASTLSSSTIPSIDSDDFAKFLETDAFLKLLENEKELSAAIEA